VAERFWRDRARLTNEEKAAFADAVEKLSKTWRSDSFKRADGSKAYAGPVACSK
jgi:hypothetical protein